MNKIFKFFKSSPKYSIKWSNYFEIYENILQKFVNKKVTLVEIGIGDGGSLFMWRKFLGKKAKIIGIELNPEAKKLEKYDFKIFTGDQSDPQFWKKFYKKNGKIDILIDDGGHTNLQQVTSFMESINHINDNGVIIVEDTHTSYMNYKGFKNPSKYSFINFSLNIIENLPDNGVDFIEIGMPFSDPMADGPSIQLSSQRALKSGMSLKKSLLLVETFRKKNSHTPIILMGYFNPIYIFGKTKFINKCNEIGVDGLIVE